MALVIGDSLLRHFPDNPKYNVALFPGIDCAGLSHKLSHGELDGLLRNVSLVIILVGTNDMVMVIHCMPIV